MPKTMFEKIWERHVVAEPKDQPALIYVDLHLVHEVTSPQAFEGLRLAGRKPRKPELTISTVDHNLPTDDTRALEIKDPIAREQVEALRKNCEEFNITLFDVDSKAQGIVHVIGPEQGYTQPGMTIVCGDSHTHSARWRSGLARLKLSTCWLRRHSDSVSPRRWRFASTDLCQPV
jgi:3-isopropylmalate/(R)-2-methylmalate dehydratase large subunit